MCTFEEFISYTDFKQFLNAGEILTIENIKTIPKKYFKKIKIFFEEIPIINAINKTKIMKITFTDGDKVFYIFKYNQIFNTKTYRLTNIPYSINNNSFHIIQVLDTLFEIMPYTTIMAWDYECNNWGITTTKKMFLPGYENYWYEYNDFQKKINSSKHVSYQLRKYLKHINLEYHNNITPELQYRINNILNLWFDTHPHPVKNHKEKVKEALKHNPICFMAVYDNKDIGCFILSQPEQYSTKCFCFDLSRNGYHNSTLLSDFLITDYLNKNFNIKKYYIGGYAPDNNSLKKYKDKWCSGKLILYALNKNHLDIIKQIIFNINGDDKNELIFG